MCDMYLLYQKGKKRNEKIAYILSYQFFRVQFEIWKKVGKMYVLTDLGIIH